ncbi:MAG: dmpA [Cyanobacteria bacterium RYN_339]|nr:dmpA [Cyanobacteria bacterium RYN_339]
MPNLRYVVALALASLALAAPAPAAEEARMRLRDLGISIGHYPTGKFNAITDVAGVKVGHHTLAGPPGTPIHTGVTAIVPRDDVWNKKVFASQFRLNGNGEMTAAHWIEEAGWLETPILLTDTLSIPQVSDGVVTWMENHYPDMGLGDDVVIPCVAECDDSFLNDQRGRHNLGAHAMTAIEQAKSGPVAEGAVGAGTGMTSFRFKGGIGTSSRMVSKEDGGYTIGILVNCNMGTRGDLRIDGVPVGQEIPQLMPKSKPSEGSIIMVLATDAPLLPHQLNRMCRRMAMGLARTGTTAHHGSGDIAIAFSTATVVPHYPKELTMPVNAINNTHLDPLFDATIECMEEAVDNALCMAKTTVGRDGNTVYALPYPELRKAMRKHGHPVK